MATATPFDPLQKTSPASAVWSDAKDAASAQLNEHKQTAAGTLADFAQALRKAAHEGGGRDSGVAGFADVAADGLERFSGTLRSKDLNALMHDAESFARKQPIAFFGAAVAAGFIAMRFLKSSQRSRNSEEI
jgi:hypothetical protein